MNRAGIVSGSTHFISPKQKVLKVFLDFEWIGTVKCAARSPRFVSYFILRDDDSDDPFIHCIHERLRLL